MPEVPGTRRVPLRLFLFLAWRGGAPLLTLHICLRPCPSVRLSQKMAVRGTSAGYLGHYVVLQGLTDTDAVYMDPGPNRCSLHCRTPVGVFDAARKSEGTDADCIVFSPA